MELSYGVHRTFVADHYHDLPGFIEARHGHNWSLEASCWLTEESDQRLLAEAIDGWVLKLDYTLLNDQTVLKDRNPTAELLAQWACEFLLERGLRVQHIKIKEKMNYWAICRPHGNP